MNHLKALFTPSAIGRMEVKNRIVMPAVHLNYSPDGAVNKKILDYFVERARGAAGLIIVGGCAIDEIGPAPMMIRVNHPRYLEGLRTLTSEVKAEGVKIAAQLYQAGRYTHSAFTGQQAVAPSAVPSRLTRETPHALTLAEIREMVSVYAQAAALVKEAGFDAVEVLASAGYLISQFLSPLTNLRTDEYGGDLENRMRFGLEVVAAIRKEIGPDFPLLVRVAGNDFMPGSNTNVEACIFCRRLEQEGVDAVNVTGGWHETLVPQTTMAVPPGAFVYLARNIKQEVNIPVIACNRINDVLLADKIIADGSADFVGMARGLIADPELPLKAKAGRLRSIRKCIGCNQGCLDSVFSLKPVTCLVNPRVGREGETEIKDASISKKILVIGGGPAGMEAARVAALRGHSVTLWEQQHRLGGQLHLAAAPPGRADFHHLASYLSAQLEELGVEVMLNRHATSEDVPVESFDAVIIATGATCITPDIPGVELKHVVSAWDVLAGNVTAGEKVVVVGGGAVGVETALYLAQQESIDAASLHFLLLQQAEKPETLARLAAKGKKSVTLVEMEGSIGRDIGITTRWTLLADLKRSQVECLAGTAVSEITPQAVIAGCGQEEKRLPADTVVLAVGSAPLNRLFAELKDRGIDVFLLGDAAAPKKAMDAMHAAFDLAMKL
jgi:2,4-dienoyl-CoA reductase (NADPH2)